MHNTKDAGDRLREAGIRVTTPRVIIYDYLLKHRTHPTCDEIYTDIKAGNPSLSLASVYNVTEKLVDHDLIIRIVSPDGERHYDAVTKFHAHFFCGKCGKIFDVSCDHDTEQLIDLPGAVVNSISVSAYGECPECASEVDP
ncbi:MAG: transcriptional repressor [Clostridiales bacterium]|nr:transcriptional repressor [Clostridiales bacterium]